MERKVNVVQSGENPDVARLLRLLCEAVHSCYEQPDITEMDKAA